MNKQELKKLIDVAAGRRPADLLISNCKVVDVYNGRIMEADIAISGSYIAALGQGYEGIECIDAGGRYACPGFIDGHIHIESSYVTPEELGRLVVPHGTTTLIADPHEIVNVSGMKGMNYMLAAAERTALDIKYMMPSCVPATAHEHAGATITAADLTEPLRLPDVLGLGEFMNFPGVIYNDEGVLDELLEAKAAGKIVDGHSPGLSGRELNAYIAGGIHDDHECSTTEEMLDRLSRGMYILLRMGSACHDLKTLVKAVTEDNSRRCLLCSDDRQPKTIFELGHLEEHLRICVQAGLSPITAIRMASLNAAECFRLHDRGGLAPGLRADLLLLDDLIDFNVQRTFIAGRELARDGAYLLPTIREDFSAVGTSFHVKDFSQDKLRLKSRSDLVHVIEILPGGVVTKKSTATIKRNAEGEFIYDPAFDLVKVAVVERHQNTGNVALALLGKYGITKGAIALSIAHDSHNIIVAGVNDADMALAVEQLIAQNGGIILVKDGEVLDAMPMPVGGIMTDQSGAWVSEKLEVLHEKAYRELGVSQATDPFMTLGFMSLAVIPELKLTDMGLFDVASFQFIALEAE